MSTSNSRICPCRHCRPPFNTADQIERELKITINVLTDNIRCYGQKLRQDIPDKEQCRTIFQLYESAQKLLKKTTDSQTLTPIIKTTLSDLWENFSKIEAQHLKDQHEKNPPFKLLLSPPLQQQSPIQEYPSLCSSPEDIKDTFDETLDTLSNKISIFGNLVSQNFRNAKTADIRRQIYKLHTDAQDLQKTEKNPLDSNSDWLSKLWNKFTLIETEYLTKPLTIHPSSHVNPTIQPPSQQSQEPGYNPLKGFPHA